MSWRPDPFTKARCADGSDWPRNGAILKGVVHEKDGQTYLQVNEIQQAGVRRRRDARRGEALPRRASRTSPQAGTTGFKSVAGQNKWMPADGGSWNGGQWLHEPKE